MVKLTQQEDGNVHCEFSNNSERRMVSKCLTYDNPNYYFIKSKMKYESDWDGTEKFFDFPSKTFPLGFLSIVTSCLRDSDIEYQFVRRQDMRFKTIEIQESKLRPYQVPPVRKFFNFMHGILKIPTRGGKTFIASEIIRIYTTVEAESKVLFLVDTIDLLTQATGDIANHIGISVDEIGSIREGKFDIKQITVCTIQTLQSILNPNKRKATRRKGAPTKEQLQQDRAKRKIKLANKRTLVAYLESIDFYIVDECHEYSSSSRIGFIHRMKNASAKLFISASPFKSESELDNCHLRTVSGDVLCEIFEQDLKEQGYLAEDKILLAMVDHNQNKNIGATEEDGYKSFHKQVITHNKNRNAILVNMIEICRKLGLKVLVLFSKKEHGNYIKSITGDHFLSGETSPKDRTFYKNQFLKMKGGVLLASDIFKKGITLPEVEVLVNAAGGLESSIAIQRKGRVLGTTEKKKKALIVDFVDMYEYFAEHSLSRIAVYEASVPEERLAVLDSDDNDFYNDFRNVVSEWFGL